MRTPYTKHNLTDAQLRRLSQMVNNDPHGHGNALDALIRKGLAYEIPGGKWPHTCRPTVDGVEALKQARREGW